MDKNKIIEALVDKVNQELLKIKIAYETTKNHSQDSDMKSDGKYDTRSIEASYLAGAQKKRVDELELDLSLLSEIPTASLEEGAEIQIGALADLEFNGQTRAYFISPTAGGTMLSIDGTPILVISVFSPIGSACVGSKAGDSFELETPKERREYSVLKVY